MAETVTIGQLTFIYKDAQLGINQEIHVADTVDFVSAQDLINGVRQAEASTLGLSYPKIANASGKAALGPGIATGITLELLDDWRVYTLKNSGVFAIGDGNIIKPDGSSPFVENSAVTYIQNLSAAATVVTTSGGGGSGATPAEIWGYSSRSLTDKTGFSLSVSGVSAIASSVWATLTSALTTVGSIGKLLSDRLSAQPASQSSVDVVATKVSEMHQMDGLDPASPLTVSDTQRSSGTITQVISDNGTTTTVTRQ